MQKIKLFFKELQPKQKVTLIAAFAIFIVIIIYSIATLIYRNGKIKTTVKYAPFAATITLNDKQISNNSTVYLLPGTYNIKVYFNDHFETYTGTITIDEENHYIAGELNYLDDEGKTYYEAHSTEYTEAEGLVGVILNEEGQRIKNKYPILNHLPFNSSIYSLSYSYDDNNVPIITVKSELKYIDVAVAKLKDYCDDLTPYQIVFTEKNPYTFYTETDETDIEKFIKNAYDFDFETSELQQLSDNYYAIKLYTHDYWQDYDYGYYIALLTKENDKWRFVTDPQPLFTTQNTPDVPVEILRAANKL